MSELTDTEREMLVNIRNQQMVNAASADPVVALVAANTTWLLDLIERLEPGSTCRSRTSPDG